MTMCKNVEERRKKEKMVYWSMTKKKVGKKKLNGAIVAQVVENVAKGKSNKEILAINPRISQSSISKIKKTKADIIEAKKKKYVEFIDKFTHGDIKQAKILAKMLKAKTQVFNFKGEVVGKRPDHKMRLEAIKYIDKLKGRDTVNNVKINSINIDKQLTQYIK